MDGAVVGRAREVELLGAAIEAGTHVVLEGPPGIGKSTLLRAVGAGQHMPFVLVEGNAELTPGRLVGHFDPAQVLTQGYLPDIFVDGPLLEAMRSGALLYVEEVNRVPEETLNVLLTVLSEGEIAVPRLGRIAADPGFRLVAAMNPYDAVGTARISSALYDRTCRLTMSYQDAEDETRIVVLRTPDVPAAWRARVVELVRRTRTHPDVRVGSSVRGAIDLTRLACSLAARRGCPVDDWDTGRDAALVALSGRVRLQESCSRSAEDVVGELWADVFGARPSPDAEEGEDPGASMSPSPPPAGAPAPSRQQPGRPRPASARTTSRAELARHPRFAELSPEVGVLDEAALESAVQQDPDAVLALLADLTRATDERLRAAASRLAGRLVLDRARTGPARSGGMRRLRAVPADRGGDLDVDASFDALLEARGERRPPSLEHLVARHWGRPATALVVLVDRSGSMAGERMAVAALVAAACALRAPEEHAVLAFAASVEVLRAVDSQSPPSVVVQAVLGLRGHGETGLVAALDEAAVQLGRTTAARKTVLLLSDCRGDPREDPLPAARRLPQLIILAPADDSDQAQDLARRAGARWAPVAGPSEVPALLDRLLT